MQQGACGGSVEQSFRRLANLLAICLQGRPAPRQRHAHRPARQLVQSASLAHRVISLFAIKRLRLDRVWWLVTPGNPLKDHSALRDLEERAEAARRMADDPRIDVSCLNPSSERVILSTPSLTCAGVLPACVLSGSWAPIISRNFIAGRTGGASPSEVPIAVIDRPPQSFRALAAPAAQALARYRLPENQAGWLADRRAPAWVFLTGLKMNLSSTGLSEPGRQLEDKVTGRHHWNIETVNPTCVVW